jgi:ketosteroid isomerase-like protein
MKANIFVSALLLFFIGCTQQQSEQLTQQQKDQIKSEVKAAMDSMGAKWVALDAEGALQFYSPNMVAVADTSLIDFQAYKMGWHYYTESTASIKVTTHKMDYIVLGKDVAFCAWIGKVERVLKSGDKVTTDPQVYTDIYKKVGSQWKIIYEHGSGVPVTQKAGKK